MHALSFVAALRELVESNYDWSKPSCVDAPELRERKAR